METIKFINTLFAKQTDALQTDALQTDALQTDALQTKPLAAKIRATMYKKGILASYADDGRMVFYTSKNERFAKSHTDETRALWMENNGLVLNTTTMTPLVIPPLSFKSNVDPQIVDTYLAKDLYKIYSVEDGTIINLYYWGHTNHRVQEQSWRISTTRGYDMTDNKWGTKTYAEILEELLGAYDTPIDKFYDSLDKARCYTFGFKHGSMHPFQEGLGKIITKLWFVQSVELATGAICDDFQSRFGIPNQRAARSEDQTTKTLFAALHTSLPDFLSGKRPANYGFILKSSNPSETKEHSHIMLESSLLQKIRQLYYHSDHNNHAKEMNYDRKKYIVIHSYLNINTHSMFIKLFPQFTEQFKELDTLTSDLVKAILVHGKKNKPPNTDISPAEQSGRFDGVSKFLYEKINRECRIFAGDRHSAKIVSSYLLNGLFTDIYYNLFTWPQ